MASKKELPHNTEAEKAVLGAMLRSNQFLGDCLARFNVDDFYEENQNHRVIFEAMYRLEQKHIAVDPRTVTDELINSKTYDISGGTEYLMELADSIITFANIPDYMNIVSDQSLLRRFLMEMEDIANTYYTKDIESISDFIGISEKRLADVAEKRRVADFVSASDITSELSKEFETLEATTTDDTVKGVPTGFTEMNKLTHGFKEGEFIVIAARPGVGKTAISLNLAFNAAQRNVPVAYFSLEMPASQLFKRLVSADSGVPYEWLQTGFHMTKQTRLKLQESCKALSKTKLYVDDTNGINILDIVAKARKLKNNKEPNLGLIIVDYIGLVKTNSKNRNDSRQLEVQMVSQTLKNLALELKIPVIGVAQLNRNVEQRGGDPMLSDLRESGSIEQDADIVMLLAQSKIEEAGENSSKNVFEKHNEEVTKQQNDIAQKEGGPDTVMVNVIIAKNRSGKTGKVPLLFRRAYCKFNEPSKEGTEAIKSLDNERVSYI